MFRGAALLPELVTGIQHVVVSAAREHTLDCDNKICVQELSMLPLHFLIIENV